MALHGLLSTKPPLPPVALAFGMMALVACGGGSGSAPASPAGNTGGGGTNSGTEFIASAQDVAKYGTWSAVDYSIGGTNPALGSAHMGLDNAFSRRIFKSASAVPSSSGYPVGSILVKETFTWQNGVKTFPATGGVFAMAKRGGTFNPQGGGWEWLALSNDGSQIMARGGADMMSGMCNACHTSAAAQTGGSDFVFPHPFEYAAAATDFANYRNWSLIQDTTTVSPYLGGAHKSSDSTAVRRIYKKQLLANPDTAQAGYPVGTIVVKEIQQNGAVTEITAMVKRGGTFNSANNGWEWFTLDPATTGIMARGADLMSGMCNGCHSLAKTSTIGADYVFKHPLDPYNH